MNVKQFNKYSILTLITLIETQKDCLIIQEITQSCFCRQILICLRLTHMKMTTTTSKSK